MKKITCGLAVCLILLNFESDAKTNPKSQITELKSIRTNLNKLKLLEKINELIKCLTEIKNMLLNISIEKNFNKSQKPYFENQTVIKNLKDVNTALQNPGTRFNTILNKGSKIFDNEETDKLFNHKNIPSDLKNSYSNALNAWKEIKRMPISDEKYDKKLNNFKEKIRLLYQNIQN